MASTSSSNAWSRAAPSASACRSPRRTLCLNVHVDFPLLQRLALPINVGSVRVPGIKIQDTGADSFDELNGSVEGSHILDATRAFSLFIDGPVVGSRAAVSSRTTSGTPILLAETAPNIPHRRFIHRDVASRYCALYPDIEALGSMIGYIGIALCIRDLGIEFCIRAWLQPCRTVRKRSRASAPAMAKPFRNASSTQILSSSRTFFATTSTSMGRALFQSERNALLLIDVGECWGRFRPAI